MNTPINEFMYVQDNSTISFNKDIIMTDMNGNQKTIVRCYCTIIAGKTISYNLTVDEYDIFMQYKTEIQNEVNKFKNEATTIAAENDVPII